MADSIFKFLEFIGRPVLRLFLVSCYLSLVALATIGKLTLQLIKFIRQLKLPVLQLPKLPRLPQLPKFYVQSTYIIVTGIALAIVIPLYFFIFRGLPSPRELTTRNQALTTKIRARDGTVLFKIYKDQNRSLVPLNSIPEVMTQATIAIEDKDFYRHGGFSYRGIIRAITRNIFHHQLQGGSTITQQLVKNALLTPEKTFTRKIKEVILAIGVELTYSKDDILKMYFNEVGYGGTAYGIEEAAQMYFGKSITQVTLAQAALLAGLPAAPTTYSPFGAYPELATSRQHEVLRRMVEDGYVTPQEAEAARAEKLVYAPQTIAIKAPHFVMYVKDLLVKTYGETTVNQGGLDVITSLDLQLQDQAQAAVSQEIRELRRLRIGNGAALITNPQTGEILSMVGSKDYFDFAEDGQVNVTLAWRQPGSSIKPVNYAVALSNGFTPATIIDDSPITYQVPGQPPYSPRNYDSKFHGPVTLRTALASSYNVPAVKTLSTFGVTKMIELGQKLGITTWNDPSRFGLSLTLGGGEVKMIDMAVAYGVLANQGLRVDLHPILKVTNPGGKVMEEFSCAAPPCNPQPALNPLVAYQLTDILSDNAARSPAFGSRSVLYIPDPKVAVKTGTTQNLRDNWTIGYTKNRLVAVWVGNNDNTPMSYVASGITGASPIWRAIFDIIIRQLADQPVPAFSPPADLVKVTICTLTGQLACTGCPAKDEYFLPGTEPKTACTPEQIETIKKKQQEDQANRDKILTGASTNQ
jgi:1A family penicillin-binding protein